MLDSMSGPKVVHNAPKRALDELLALAISQAVHGNVRIGIVACACYSNLILEIMVIFPDPRCASFAAMFEVLASECRLLRCKGASGRFQRVGEHIGVMLDTGHLMRKHQIEHSLDTL